MPVPSELARDPSVAGPLGSLALSCVRPGASTLALRTVRWQRDLTRLGVDLPYFIVHDLGLLLAAPNEQLAIAPRADVDARLPSGGAELVGRYAQTIGEVAESEAAQRSRALDLSDDLIVVLLARLLGTVSERVATGPAYTAAIPMDAAMFERLDEQLVQLFTVVPRQFEVAALEAVDEARLYVLTLVDALDLDTLQLFGMVGGDAAGGALAQVDLLGMLGAPEANDVVNFSLEILPSVLEAKTKAGAGTVPAFGYAGLARKGSIDNMVLTELAWDEAELMRRMADDEVLYYAREQIRDRAGRIHHVLVDASASMRGERATFARGMALAASKKLVLAGEDVVVRFFDSRLYEPHGTVAGKLPVGHILSFKGERGRNPAKVFAELLTAIQISTARDPREPIVHLFTHAALYIPRETMLAISRLCKVSAVFMLPSGGDLDLDYLDALDAHWVVDHETLGSRNERASAAKHILADVEPRPSSATGDGATG